MSGGTFTRVMTKPLMKPASAPTKSEKAIASGSGKCERLPRIAEHDRAQADDRADREIDTAGDDDESHRQRDEADLGHEPALIEKIVQGQKAVVQEAEAKERDQEDDREQRLVTLEPAGHAKRLRFDREAHRFHP